MADAFHRSICTDRTTKYAGMLTSAPAYVAEFFPAVEWVAERHGLRIDGPGDLAAVVDAAVNDPELRRWQVRAVQMAAEWLEAAEREKRRTVAAVFGRESRVG